MVVCFSSEISVRKCRTMLHKVALALLLLFLVVVSQVAAAGPVKFALTPTDGTTSAHGTLRFVNGKPSDAECSFHLSFTGSKPDTGYYLQVYAPDGYQLSLGVFTDAKGSCTASGSTSSRILSATKAEIVEGMTAAVVMTGKSQ